MKKELEIQKHKINKIIEDFEEYYQVNHLNWDVKETSAAHQILGTLILTFKKVEYMENAFNYFTETNLLDYLQLELEEVKIITDYYSNVFIKNGA